MIKGVWEVRKCIELHSAFQNYTTIIFSMEIHTNNCIVLIKLDLKNMRVEDQKLKIKLEWPYGRFTFCMKE